MKRRLLLALSALSLSVFVAAADQWLHGSGRGYFISRESAPAPDGSAWRTEWSIGVDRIAVAFGRFRGGYLFPLKEPGRWQLGRWSPQYSAPPRRPPHGFLGFGWAGRHPRATGYGCVTVPMWFVCTSMALGGIPFALAARRGVYATCRALHRLPGAMRRRRWCRLGLCGGCGYDLTANVSGVCPECGSPSAPRDPVTPTLTPSALSLPDRAR